METLSGDFFVYYIYPPRLAFSHSFIYRSTFSKYLCDVVIDGDVEKIDTALKEFVRLSSLFDITCYAEIEDLIHYELEVPEDKINQTIKFIENNWVDNKISTSKLP